MQKENFVDLTQYTYNLPDEKIAFEGTRKREDSKLLFYSKGVIKDYHFSSITELVPTNATLFFNNTKVIPARIIMSRSTGASIELFLLKPAYQKDIAQTLESNGSVAWECMIGNLKKWKEGEELFIDIKEGAFQFTLIAKLADKASQIVEFSCDNKALSFAQILDILGKTPLPPYIKREVRTEDKERYQTVYSKIEGAVAAPTAGLHFTKPILSTLRKKGIKEEFFTLHVGAGTFMPIKADSVREHPMHNESVIIPIEAIQSLLQSKFRVAVGTTSMRTLESLYWFGVKLINNPEADFVIEKLYPYENNKTAPTLQESIEAVLKYAKGNNLEKIHGSTEIFIFPGYEFKVCDALLTNFHQPGSTLILLVAAFIGQSWNNIYKHALENDYRFLSFGDSSLLIP